MNHNEAAIVVSVVMITYGHEKFIQQAIEGVLTQQTEYTVELIIGNDSSPDETDSIVQEIISTHPNSSRIRYTRHEKNKGMQGNFIWALQQAKGRYIALCDGDDYWTDPLKLQKQVTFLEKNPDYCLCAGYSGIIESHSDEIIYPVEKPEKRLNLDEILITNAITTLTAVVRNLPGREPLFKALKTSPLGDWILYIYTGYITKGGFYIFPEVFGVYRHHGGGIFSSVGSSNTIVQGFQAMKLSDDLTQGEYAYLSVLSELCIAQWNNKALDQFKYIQHHVSDSTLTTQKKEALLKLLSGDIKVEKVLDKLSLGEKNISVIAYVMAILYHHADGKVELFTRKINGLLKEITERGLNKELLLVRFITGYWMAIFRLFPSSFWTLLRIRKYNFLFSHYIEYKNVIYLYLRRFKRMSTLLKWKRVLGI